MLPKKKEEAQHRLMRQKKKRKAAKSNFFIKTEKEKVLDEELRVSRTPNARVNWQPKQLKSN